MSRRPSSFRRKCRRSAPRAHSGYKRSHRARALFAASPFFKSDIPSVNNAELEPPPLEQKETLKVSLQSCLKTMFAEEKLDDNIQNYECVNCSKRTSASKSLTVHNELPECLLLHLKRFHYENSQKHQEGGKRWSEENNKWDLTNNGGGGNNNSSSSSFLNLISSVANRANAVLTNNNIANKRVQAKKLSTCVNFPLHVFCFFKIFLTFTKSQGNPQASKMLRNEMT